MSFSYKLLKNGNGDKTIVGPEANLSIANLSETDLRGINIESAIVQGTALENDEFLKMLKKAETDREFSIQMQSVSREGRPGFM